MMIGKIVEILVRLGILEYPPRAVPVRVRVRC